MYNIANCNIKKEKSLSIRNHLKSVKNRKNFTKYKKEETSKNSSDLFDTKHYQFDKRKRQIEIGQNDKKNFFVARLKYNAMNNIKKKMASE